jgi:hypothetical protein
MDTSVIAAVGAIAGAVSAVAGLAKIVFESPFFKKALKQFNSARIEFQYNITCIMLP